MVERAAHKLNLTRLDLLLIIDLWQKEISPNLALAISLFTCGPEKRSPSPANWVFFKFISWVDRDDVLSPSVLEDIREYF